jgi:alkyldihydroxyacetonephosphate synthase
MIHAQDHLVEVEGTALVSDVEKECRDSGFTLDLSAYPEASVATWIAEGLPGTRSPFLDPADHVIAGLNATLKSGVELRVPPCPRRSAGPDMIALLQGQWGRFGTVERVWLRIHPRGAARPTHGLAFDTNPPLNAMEEVMLVILQKEMS